MPISTILNSQFSILNFLHASTLGDFFQTFGQELVKQRFLISEITILALSFLTFKYVRRNRGLVRTNIVIFILHLLSIPVTAALLFSGLTVAAGYVRVFGDFLYFATLINVSALLLFEGIGPRLPFEIPTITRDISIFAAYVFAVLALTRALNFNISGLIATSAVITAVIGLSMQDTLGNTLAGLALQIEQRIRVGDWVKIDQYNGKVREIRWRHTAIETRNWDTILIPNSQLVKGMVTIFGRRTNEPLQTRRWVYFNVDFRFSPNEVMQCITDALRSAPIENVAQTPPPNVVLMDFKESYCQYAVRYWLTDIAVDDPTDSAVRVRIFFALKRAGITLSLPAHAVFLTEENRKRRQRKEEAEITHRVEALKGVELFHTLTEDELSELAREIVVAPFAKGETITKQGAVGHWLYILTKGCVSVRVAANATDIGKTGALEKEVRQLCRGEVFGEMSLLTGEPRSATVFALEDCECFKLDKEAFQSILENRPEITDDISRILAKRKLELDSVLEDLDEATRQARMKHNESHFLERIRSFFALD